MTSEREQWSSAYLEQARSDWQVYRFLADNKIHPCHQLHYLQMATEKLGKAFLLANSQTSINKATTSHKGFAQLINRAKRSRQFRKHYGNLPVQQFFSLASSIEKLSPALAKNKINCEYPWLDGKGNIASPCRTNFMIYESLKQRNGITFLQLLSKLFQEGYIQL